MTTISPIQNSAESVTKQVKVCGVDDLVANSGVCVLVENTQIALFSIIDKTQKLHVYACDNYDPIGKANVLSRGILCSVEDEICICSPLYKQHFSLQDGRCLEDSSKSVKVYKSEIHGNDVSLFVPVR